MLNILFVFSDHYCSVTRKRTLEVVNALNQYKKSCLNTQAIYYKKLNESHFKKFDIIVFQRLGANGGILSSDDIKILFFLVEKFKGKTTCVYDIDDYVFNDQNGFPLEMMRICDWVITPNEFLQNKIKEFQPKCHIIRTHIDLEALERVQLANEEFDQNYLHIGWFSANAYGIEIIQSIYSTLLKQYEGKILIHIYASFPYIKAIKEIFNNRLIITHNCVTILEMYAISKAMAFHINPVSFNDILSKELDGKILGTPSDFLNSKSEIKYLHAGAVGKPLITTPIPSYRDTVLHCVTGYFAETEDDWIKYIDLLINNPEERTHVGLNAQKHIYSNYSFENVSNNYAKFFAMVKKN